MHVDGDRPEIRALIAELAEPAEGRDDLGTDAAGTLAGSWFASPDSSYADGEVASRLDPSVRILGVGNARK